MRSAAQTYKSVARQTSSPRELEASLLLQAAARLQSVHDTWDIDFSRSSEINFKTPSTFVGSHLSVAKVAKFGSAGPRH